MNIVSIDFDIIMAPSIQYYNNFAGPVGDKLFKEQFFSNCEADLAIYQKLSEWLYYSVKNSQLLEIIFIESHDSIINYIPQGEKEINLINIDYHHDLGYNGKGKIFKDKDEVNCGNWCNYLITNNLIHSYLWIGDKSSNKWNCDYPYHHIKHMNLFNLKADKIIICLSPEYIPEKYWPLFYIWMSTIGFLKNTNYYLI